MKPKQLRSPDDSGAALVIALVFVTVVAVAIAGVLSYADANVRATVALRNQARTVASAESAAEVAINALRNSDYDESSEECLNSGSLTLNSFDPPMTVSCEYDTTNSEEGSNGSPSGYALRTLQANSLLENAIYVKANGAGTGINIAGDVGSTSNIFMDHGDMNVTGTVDAKICTGTITASVAKHCGPSAPAVGDPDYSKPAAPTVSRNVPACAAKMTFSPGLYTDLRDLNEAWSRCPAATLYDFQPGIYYFSFNGVWTIDKGTTIGGAPSLGSTPPSIPGACPNPLTNTGSTAGVTFVFGGEAQLLITDNAKVEICGRRPPAGSSDPSMAFYGLKSAHGSGAFSVPAQSGCVTRYGSGSRCAAITTDNHSDGVRFYFQGHVYMPLAQVDLDLRRSSDQYLNGGVTVRSFSLFSPASGVIPTPLSSGPIVRPRPGRTIVFLTVYECTATPCAAGSGKTRLKVKVGFADPGGPASAGPRGVTIYNWSVVR